MDISILFEKGAETVEKDEAAPPGFFADLNIDQIIDAITTGREEYNLKPFFYTPLQSAESIRYRHEVFQDLENSSLFKHIKSFTERMRAMREHSEFAGKLYYKYQKGKYFLDAVGIYCDAVKALAADLSSAALKSLGLLAFREYVTNYAESEHFTSLVSETENLKADLASVKYCINIKGDCVRVRKYNSEIDYSANVEATFEKFRQGAARDYRADFPIPPHMNHVEARVLDLVARLYPDIFLALEDYCARNGGYADEGIALFDREIQFYLACLEYVAIFKEKGLKFCYPEIHADSKEVYDYEGFDLALANILASSKNSSIVCNDFYLKESERIFVVSGPNQGGKTTFARMFGQLHYLGALGCPVPGRKARLFLFDRILTHFEREEDIQNLRGKLEDDLVRIQAILDQATSESIVIMNEIFTSTTLSDALFLSKKIMGKIMELDMLGVWVTFVDELASLSAKTVSLVSTVSRENPALRTFKIVRRPAAGLAYALSIAEKHRVTYEHLIGRIG